jgi:outer membrane protein assembly factor BamB
MFVITHEHLHAVDIYTGRYLWQAEMPKTPQVEARYEDSRIYGRPVDRNCVATDEAVYVVLEEAIHVYSAVDGSKQAVIGFPDVAPRGTFQLRWTEVRIDGDLLYAVLGRTLVALNRRTGELLWRRESTQKATTYTIGDGKIFGLDYVGTQIGGRRRPATVQGSMFALDAGSGEPQWSRQVQYDSVPEHKVDHPRPWLLPPNPELIYNARHGLIVLAARRNSVRVFRAVDGEFVWEQSGLSGNVQRTYTPVVTDDYLVLSGFQGFFGYVLDVRTGQPLEQAGIPRPRTCARIIGNNHLLVYRDAATELYDLPARRMIGLNSVRSGCTTSFIPAGGILTAPMLGHGCVCNYPMFASLAMYPTHDFEPYRPKRVVASWENEAAGTEIVGGVAVPRRPEFPKDLRDVNVDVARYTPTNATLKKAEGGLLFSTDDDTVGYALRPAEHPVRKASFRCAVRRASGPGRHGNAFLVLSPEGAPEKLIECRLYYGGRSSLMITGPGVERVDKRAEFQRGGVYTMRVDVDCPAGVVTFQAAGQKLTAKMNDPWPAVAAYGYGGGNSDNLFTGIRVDTQESRR